MSKPFLVEEPFTIDDPEVNKDCTNAYITVGILADKAALAFRCFVDDRENYEFPSYLLEEVKDLLSSPYVITEAFNSSETHTSANSYADLLFEAFEVTKGSVQSLSQVTFSQFISNIRVVLSTPTQERKNVANNTMFDFISYLENVSKVAIQKIPDRIDVGSHVMHFRK